jgi:hypothetical protein
MYTLLKKILYLISPQSDKVQEKNEKW